PQLIYAERASRRLSRAILYIMARHQEALKDDQGRQNRIEMVGEEILTIVATALYAESQDRVHGEHHVWDLANEVFETARKRIDGLIPEIIHNDDKSRVVLGKRALRGQYSFLNSGIIQRGLKDYLPKGI
ncbi:MAG: hypothetical protein VST68_01215, partial [Nitrospirota bacterium]|nr:hypothetical protein [Nitrospirota bacterium]